MNLKKKLIFIKNTFFSNFLNSLIIIDKNENIKKIDINLENENYKIQILKKNNIFGIKKLKEITSEKFGDFLNFFKKKKIKFQNEYIFKEFDNFLIILKNKIKIFENEKIIEEQNFLIFEYKNKSEIIFVKEFSLNKILGINIIILQNLKNFEKLFKKKKKILDFYINSKKDLFLLLENKMELKINIFNLNLKKLKIFKFLDGKYNSLILDKYIDEKKILGFLNEKIFLIEKSNLNCYAYDDFENIDSFSILDLGDYNFEFFEIFKIQKNNFLKNEKEKFLVLNKEGFLIFEKLTKIDFFANLIILEVFYGKFLTENFFLDFFERKKKIGLKKILEILSKMILVNKNDFFVIINDYISLLISKYGIEVKNFLHEKKKNFDFLKFQMIIFKYYQIFSGEIKNLNFQKMEKISKNEKILKLKKNENYNERIILNVILNIIKSFENDKILQNVKNDNFIINRKIDIKLKNVKIEITNLLKNLFFFENILKKNENFIFLMNNFINYIKNIKFQNFQKIFILEKEIFSKNIIDFVFRIKNIISFLIFFKKILKFSKKNFLKKFLKLNLKDLFFFSYNDMLIKDVIIYNFEFINLNENNFVNNFLDRNYIEALIEFEKFKKKKFLKNFENEKNFVEKIKFLDFCYLKDFIYFFWEKNCFDIFLKIILEKLKNDKKFLKENELMKIFIFATLINLLSEKNIQKKNSLKIFLKKILKKTKKKILEKIQKKENFNLSQNLKNLKNSKRLEIIKNLIKNLLKHKNEDLRKKTIFLLLQNNELKYIKKTDYENKINDIIKISTEKKMFENKIGFKNGFFMINFLVKNKKFFSAFEIILKILQNKKIENFLANFENKKNFFYLLNENFKENFEKWKKIEFLGLEELLVIIDQGNNLKKKIDLKKKENLKKFEILKNIEINLKLNILIKKDLITKKKFFERILKLDKNLINFEIIEKIIELLNFEIFYINLNPKFEKNNILEKIIKKNKLYYTMYKLPKFISNTEFSFLYKKKILINLLIFFGKLNNENSISKISNHFEIPEIFQNFKILKNPENEKNENIKIFQKLKIIFPYNLPEKIHEILYDFFENKKIKIEDIKKIIKIIEKFNMNNKYFKILIQQIFSFEHNILNSQSLWHLFYIYNKFEKNNIKKKNNNLKIIFSFLNAYFLLCKESVQNQNKELGSENLKFKFFHSFLILFEFLILQIQKFLLKKECFLNEKEILVNFCINFEFLKNCLESVSGFTLDVVSQNTFFCAYFKFKEKINMFLKLIKKIYWSKEMNPYRK